jgi:putative membrane-bound dehydrogenase-like protein
MVNRRIKKHLAADWTKSISHTKGRVLVIGKSNSSGCLVARILSRREPSLFIFPWMHAKSFRCPFRFSRAVILLSFVIGPWSFAEGLSPVEEQKTFSLEPNLKVELIAAEPTVVAPVAIAFDEEGRMFVAENRGYPTGGPNGAAVGRIALLEDKDGDGIYETRTDFAEGLTFPNGVMPWKGGVFVTCAPDLFYLKDTDGDGKADLKKVVLTGFATTGSTQLRVCHPTFAPDNWVYMNGGLSGGKITSPDFPDHPAVDMSRNDIRFRPDADQFEATDGKGQFGLTFDDFGHRFFCMNRIQVQHVVTSSRYWKRNPNLAFTETVQDCPESMMPEPLKGHRAAARIYPTSHNITTADSHAGTFTAACGVTFYNGTALPAEFYGDIFSCDPAGNLVHRDKLIPSGATFIARRSDQPIEFFASSDDWCRPVNLTVGPDGALYICDMYRKTIEHPEYLSPDIRKRTDFESGKNLGRIWRVTAANHKREPLPNLKNASINQLTKYLAHPNGWVGATAQRLLFRKGDDAVARSLIMFMENHSSEYRDQIAGFRALNLLAGMYAYSPEDIRSAVRQNAPGCREAGLILSESFLRASKGKLLETIITLAEDTNSRVRFQCALTLGEASDKSAILQPLARIAARDAADRWARAAVLSSITGVEQAFLDEALRQQGAAPAYNFFLREATAIAAKVEKTNGIATLQQKLFALPNKSRLLASYTGLLDAIGKDGLPKDREQRLTLFNHARVTSQNAARDLDERLIATAFLGFGETKESLSALTGLLDPKEPVDIQKAAVQSLLAMRDPEIVHAVLEPLRWNILSPSVRETLLSGIISRPVLLPELLNRLEKGEVPASTLSASQRKQLREHKDPAVRAAAEKLFASADSSDRMKIFSDYKSVLDLKADPRNGQKVFLRACGTCHRLDREGTAVGPDLFSIRNQPKETILLHIIVPDYEIVPGFTGYNVELKDGTTLSGLIISETDSAITLRLPGGADQNVLRTNVQTLQSSKTSLMPQELEKTMTREEMGDLVAYLKGE